MTNEIMKFDYNSSHNNFPAIESLNPIDIGTERQFWFTANMLADMFGVDAKTIRNRINTLENIGDLSGKNFSLIKIPDSNGRQHETTIYDLTAFNKLVMTMIDNPVAVNARAAFNDVIVQVETTGSYNIQKLTPSYEIEDPIKRAKAWIVEQEAKLALEAENKTLKADNNNLTQVLTDTSEKLITAIRTKAQINDKRTATIMGKLSGQSKKITRLENDLNTANDNINKLQTELDDTYSSLYRDKRVAEIIKGKYEFITYKFNTLKPRVNKALKAIALVLNEPIKEKPNPMNDTYAPMLYFTKRVVDQLLDNIEKDHNYLKRFGK